jgi:hypothetical protein
MIELLKQLKADRGKYGYGASLRAAINENSELKQLIVRLGRHFFNESVTGCRNCIEDMYLRLITYDMDKKTPEYSMRNGKLLHDPINQDAGKLLCSANLTEELVLYHLVHNPNARKFFEKLPEDIDARIEAYKKAHSLIVDVTDTNADRIDAQIEEKKAQLEALEKAVDSQLMHLNNLNEQIAKRKAALAELDKEIEAKTAILTAIVDDDSENLNTAPPAPAEKSAKDVQKDAEDAFIIQVADLLKAGKTPADVKAELKSVKKVGVLNLTDARFDKFIAEAEDLLKV